MDNKRFVKVDFPQSQKFEGYEEETINTEIAGCIMVPEWLYCKVEYLHNIPFDKLKKATVLEIIDGMVSVVGYYQDINRFGKTISYSFIACEGDGYDISEWIKHINNGDAVDFYNEQLEVCDEIEDESEDMFNEEDVYLHAANEMDSGIIELSDLLKPLENGRYLINL